MDAWKHKLAAFMVSPLAYVSIYARAWQGVLLLTYSLKFDSLTRREEGKWNNLCGSISIKLWFLTFSLVEGGTNTTEIPLSKF